MQPRTALIDSYYWTALTALRVLDERGGRRRFGADADARWRGFAGEDPGVYHRTARDRVFTAADRVDLLLRDADVQWPGAFGARAVFDLAHVAEDDAFGHAWRPFADADAAWRQVSQAPPEPDLARLLPRLAAFWDVPLAPAAPLPPLDTHARWLLHGPSAVAAAIVAFAADASAVWHAQVTVVAGSPLDAGLSPRQRRDRGLTRQLAALAAGLLGQPRPTRILRSAPAADELRDHARLGAPAEAA